MALQGLQEQAEVEAGPLGLDPAERFGQALAGDGLQQVVAGRPAEGLEGVLVEGGHEGDGRQSQARFPGSPEQAEGALGGKLDVQEQQVQARCLKQGQT